MLAISATQGTPAVCAHPLFDHRPDSALPTFVAGLPSVGLRSCPAQVTGGVRTERSSTRGSATAVHVTLIIATSIFSRPHTHRDGSRQQVAAEAAHSQAIGARATRTPGEAEGGQRRRRCFR